VIEKAFRRWPAGRGDAADPVDGPAGGGEVDVKTAYIPGFDGFAIKVSPGFFDNPDLGLPSLNGLMILFSAKTGLVEAVFLDNGYLTDIRTAAAGAVAARHLAPERCETAGVIGTGVQARLQIEAAHLVRPFPRVLVWGRDPRKGRRLRRRPRAQPRDRGPGRRTMPPAGAPKPARRHHHARRGAGADGRLAASRPARHRHGLGPGRQERDRGRRRWRGPISMSATGSASARPRRIAQRAGRRRLVRRRRRRSWARSSPAPTRDAGRRRMSRSAI
jgi:hypothetical protein